MFVNPTHGTPLSGSVILELHPVPGSSAFSIRWPRL